MMKFGDVNDPTGLIYESFRIEDISPSECRTIFFEWALSLPVDTDTTKAVEHMLATYADQPNDHPMKAMLREAMVSPDGPKRRGGARRKVC